MDIIKGFYSLANEYCCFISTAEITEDSLSTLMELLMKLYVLAANLPDAEPDTIECLTAGEVDISPIKFSNQILRFYWEVFDPYEKDEPVCGDLLDDLSDIAKDLKKGIAEYEAGRTGNAINEWKFGLYNHYGSHIVDALRALHTARTRNI